MKKLCLNMIVRNEADKIIRCLKAVAPYISCAAIFDTGSTDGTPEVMAKFFDANEIPHIIKVGVFENFEQARNDALEIARRSSLEYDYILFDDADMVLKVDDVHFRDNLTEATYGVTQKSGSLSYHNIRLVRRDVTAKYRGVTHEYFDHPQSAVLQGVWFEDHADGTNRKDKFKRDIALLKKGLEKEPDNGRYWFYLAQSYRDAGLLREAAAAYSKRMNMPGWDEEVWCSRLNYGHCLLDLKDEGGFIREMLAAYNERPTRAEPLYDLAKFYRERGQHYAALLILDAALKIPYPGDSLFINDYAYKCGLRQEYSVCAFYDKDRRDKGFEVTNQLALDGKAWPVARDHARENLYHYMKGLKTYCPSFRSRQMKIDADGWNILNPSIANHGDQILCIIRSVNYDIDEHGRYLIKGIDGTATNDNPIRTRNYLVRLEPQTLAIETCKEILHPKDMPPPKYDMVLGFEDMRLVSYRGSLYTSSTVRELNPEGWCEQWLSRLTEEGHQMRIDSYNPMLPPVRATEKNWMPFVDKYKNLRFMYRLNTIVNEKGLTVTKCHVPDIAFDNISGGSQLVPFKTGFLAIVHEARLKPGSSKRYYYHRFVWWNHGMIPERISAPFFLHDKQIEFVAGMAWSSDKKDLLFSYGVDDKEAWLGSVRASEVEGVLWPKSAS